jgi:hypothetical protein
MKISYLPVLPMAEYLNTQVDSSNSIEHISFNTKAII